MLNAGDTIGLVACSNALEYADKCKIDSLISQLKKNNVNCVLGKYIFSDNSIYSGSGKDKADDLMNFYKNNKIKAIFDISGGDIANEVIMYLDFDEINRNYKPFLGYSDLTTIINALYTKTNKNQYLYQIRNLIYDCKDIQISRFNSSLLKGEEDLFDFKYEFIKGKSMKGIMIGGNIRCFLKLAGTQYMPDFNEKILFLEAYSGSEAKVITYLSQLKEMGAFSKVSGIVFGTFLELSQSNKCIKDIALNFFKEENIPIALTNEIGHKTNSKSLVIGKEYML